MYYYGMQNTKTYSDVIIEEASRVGSFLVKHEDGTYEMREELKDYLLWKQLLADDKESLNNA